MIVSGFVPHECVGFTSHDCVGVFAHDYVDSRFFSRMIVSGVCRRIESAFPGRLRLFYCWTAGGKRSPALFSGSIQGSFGPTICQICSGGRRGAARPCRSLRAAEESKERA